MYDSYAAILKKNLLKRRETITPFSRPGRISIVTWAKHATAIVASVDSFDSTISVAAQFSVGASGSGHKDSQPQTKGLTNRQPRPQEERSQGPTPTILWHVFQYLVIMTFRRPFRPKSPRRIGNQIIQLESSCRYSYTRRQDPPRDYGETVETRGLKRGQQAALRALAPLISLFLLRSFRIPLFFPSSKSEISAFSSS